MDLDEVTQKEGVEQRQNFTVQLYVARGEHPTVLIGLTFNL